MDIDTLFTLHKKGMITDEVLARCLDDIYSKKDDVMTDRKHSDEQNYGLNDIDKFTIERDALVKQEQERQKEEIREYLRNIVIENGNKKYNDYELQRMSYVDLFDAKNKEEHELEVKNKRVNEIIEEAKGYKEAPVFENKREEYIKTRKEIQRNLMKEYLSKILNKDGSRKYTDEVLEKMSYVELFETKNDEEHKEKETKIVKEEMVNEIINEIKEYKEEDVFENKKEGYIKTRKEIQRNLMKKYLSKVLTKEGSRKYTDEVLENMSYVELFDAKNKEEHKMQLKEEKTFQLREEYVKQEQEKRRKEIIAFLCKIINKEGTYKYNISDLEKMSYVKLLIINDTEENNINAQKKNNVGSIYDLREEIVREKQAKKKEEMIGYLSRIDNKDGSRKYSDEDLEKMSYVMLFNTMEMEKSNRVQVKNNDYAVDNSITEFDEEAKLNNLAKNITSDEYNVPVTKIKKASDEEKQKFTKSKNNRKKQFLIDAAVVTGFLLVSSVAGSFGAPLVAMAGIGSYFGLKQACKTNTWNPENKYLKSIKETIQKIYNKFKHKELIEEGVMIK